MRLAVWVGAVAVLVGGGPALAQERKPDVQARLEGHRGGVGAIAFHPRVSLIATGAGNGLVRVWETKSGDLAARMDPLKTGGGAKINHLGFSIAFNGNALSASSRNSVVAWDLTPPAPPPKPDPKDPVLPELKDQPPPKKNAGPRDLPVVFEDGLGTDPVKIGTITGDGRRVYLAATEGVRVAVHSHALSSRFGTDTNDELKGLFTPWAVAAMPDADSGLVAMYGSSRNIDKTEQPAVAFVGLGDGRVVARGHVRAPIAGRPLSIGFAPDGKWLVACNGEDLMYWKVPGSQVIEGEPKILAGSPAYAAAAGPGGRVAFASPPEDGKKVKVTIADISGSQSKVVAVYTTDIDRVTALAFSPDGSLLGVADDTEGVVQLWNLESKK